MRRGEICAVYNPPSIMLGTMDLTGGMYNLTGGGTVRPYKPPADLEPDYCRFQVTHLIRVHSYLRGRGMEASNNSVSPLLVLSFLS